mmetsp:Transcript_10100/g.18648  ORF Transcript_10100/g.18648 Transcript_10100/m.18648 type:complete len:289 (+) Transcript_10100:1075-1941(+)
MDVRVCTKEVQCCHIATDIHWLVEDITQQFSTLITIPSWKGCKIVCIFEGCQVNELTILLDTAIEWHWHDTTESNLASIKFSSAFFAHDEIGSSLSWKIVDDRSIPDMGLHLLEDGFECKGGQGQEDDVTLGEDLCRILGNQIDAAKDLLNIVWVAAVVNSNAAKLLLGLRQLLSFVTKVRKDIDFISPRCKERHVDVRGIATSTYANSGLSSPCPCKHFINCGTATHCTSDLGLLVSSELREDTFEIIKGGIFHFLTDVGRGTSTHCSRQRPVQRSRDFATQQKLYA